jgi:hypothetical protein
MSWRPSNTGRPLRVDVPVIVLTYVHVYVPLDGLSITVRVVQERPTAAG